MISIHASTSNLWDFPAGSSDHMLMPSAGITAWKPWRGRLEGNCFEPLVSFGVQCQGHSLDVAVHCLVGSDLDINSVEPLQKTETHSLLHFLQVG